MKLASRFYIAVFIVGFLFFTLYTPSSTAATAVHPRQLPNLELTLERRSYTPGEKVTLRLSAFNLPVVQLAAYPIDLSKLVQTSKVLEDFGPELKKVDVAQLIPARYWKVPMGKIQRDEWTEKEVVVPRLAPGVYLIRAWGGGVEKRTWCAITEIALLGKRSRQELLVFAADANSGKPVPALELTARDDGGRQWEGRTDPMGVWRVNFEEQASGTPHRMGGAGPSRNHTAQYLAPDTNLWINGNKNGSPAFLLSGAPAAPNPYTVYSVTDRPIYRPSQKIQFKGTVRQRIEDSAPGGFRYQAYSAKPVSIEIRDATDALVYRRQVETNPYGSFSGEFQLASEPTLGRWQLVTAIGENRSYAPFEVQAYRKPEFTVGVRFAHPHYLGGASIPVVIDSQYYFGQPVPNAAIKYNISFQAQGPGEVEPAYEGQGITDAKGQLKLDIQTQRHPVDRVLSVGATVTDLSRRSQTGQGSTLVTGSLFRLSLQADRYVYRPGQQVTVTVQASDYDDKPVDTAVQIKLVETRYNRLRQPYQETTERAASTGAAGKATVIFTPPRAGYLSLEADATDNQGNKVQAAGSLWVAGEDYAGYDYGTLNLVADRTIFQPGETAVVLLNTSLVTPQGAGTASKGPRKAGEAPPPPTYKEAWAMVTVEGERLYSNQVVHLSSRSTLLKIPVKEAYFPSVQVNVAIIQEKQVYEQQIQLQAPRVQQNLQVSVAADKAHYMPGEKATYTVTTRNYQGKPVPAEVALGVVDASIYAIRPDNAAAITSAFYSGQTIRIQSDFSFAARYSGGAFQTVSRAQAQSGGISTNIRVRRYFVDTAYWNPYVDTGGDGTATVSFTVPDNLTTWRATARGITLDTSVGSGTQEVVSTMPLLVRLELPRFYVQGDQALLSAIVHNYTGEPRTVHTRIQAEGADLQGEAERTLQLAAGEQQRLEWTAHIHQDTVSSVSPTGTAETKAARFVVTADGGEGGQDATELTLPVLPNGLKMLEARADVLPEDASQFHQDLGAVPPNATLKITLTPSIASGLLDAVGSLESYPYGCAEQTMSSFLPDVMVGRALHRLGVERTGHSDLSGWVNVGLQRLYRYQHSDGGWHWWEFDQTDGDMTAYVLWGLIQAREAGYLVDEQRILRGTDALLNLLGREQELGRRAEWMLTLACVRPEEAARPLAALYEKRGELDSYGQASLCLALVETARRLPPPGTTARLAAADKSKAAVKPLPTAAQLRTMASTLAQGLIKEALRRGTSVHWTGEKGGYSWRSDDVDVTAHVLRAVLTVAPGSEVVPPAVRWLMASREGQAWSSTRTSAEAVYALAQYMERTGELHPDYQSWVDLDGQVVRNVIATSKSALDPPSTLTLTPEQWHGHHTLTIRRQGVGVLYLSQLMEYILPPDQSTPQNHGISVRRFFRAPVEDPSQAGTVASGTDMDVEVEINSDTAYRHVIVEDPVPAGCEVAPVEDLYGRYTFSGSDGGEYVARQEVRDDRVVFFFDDLPKGRTHLSYRLHAETPGFYTILPSLASLIYFPEIRGNSGLVRAKIGE